MGFDSCVQIDRDHHTPGILPAFFALPGLRPRREGRVEDS